MNKTIAQKENITSLLLRMFSGASGGAFFGAFTASTTSLEFGIDSTASGAATGIAVIVEAVETMDGSTGRYKGDRGRCRSEFRDVAESAGIFPHLGVLYYIKVFDKLTFEGGNVV